MRSFIDLVFADRAEILRFEPVTDALVMVAVETGKINQPLSLFVVILTNGALIVVSSRTLALLILSFLVLKAWQLCEGGLFDGFLVFFEPHVVKLVQQLLWQLVRVISYHRSRKSVTPLVSVSPVARSQNHGVSFHNAEAAGHHKIHDFQRI